MRNQNPLVSVAVLLSAAALILSLGMAGKAGWRLWAQEQSPAPAQAPSSEAPAPAPSASRRVVLPEGEGKAIATDYCQECHRLTNLTSARKTADEWRETVMLMYDRGASIPQDKIAPLIEYLAKNFGPKEAASAPAASTGPSTPTSAAAPPASGKPELPEGEAKALTTEFCQDCHGLSMLTGLRKSSEEWRETVQVMVGRGARLPNEKIDSLVEYLVKNFGPKPEAAPVAPPASPQN